MATTSMHQLMTIGVTFVLLNALTTTNSESPIMCEENKEFLECGSACPTNCSHYDVPPGCTKQCVRGCFCMEDYLPNESGVCVLKKLCESCKGNTVYSGCGTACPTTCDNMFDTGEKDCLAVCKIGCVCKPGYVLLNEKEESCVLPKDCPCKNSGQ
ncbi:serine protease inhibitor swm-1-like [Mixophyes fleayi]|uniref:serine protease inhibitor swm-1-like n=1 Tax=Mixophyes fleayi TaxID=3061075 RepID=UPI003F4DFD3F